MAYHTADSIVSCANTFINFWLLFFDTRRETILKSLSYHTMLTTSFNGRNPTLCPNGWNWTIVFHGPTSKSRHGRISTSPHHGRNLTSTVCLNGKTAQLSVYMAKSQLPTDSFSKSSKSQDHRFPAWRHSHSSPNFLPGVYYDNCNCHILSARV